MSEGINNVTIQSEDLISLFMFASTNQNHTLLVIKYHLMANRIFFTNSNQGTQADAGRGENYKVVGIH